MGARERILSIRLMEKLQNHPELARAMGITACENIVPPGTEEKKET